MYKNKNTLVNFWYILFLNISYKVCTVAVLKD